MAIGVVVGNMPILGISSILCGDRARISTESAGDSVVQAAMAPTQILLIIPFIRLGEWILRAPRQSVSIKEWLALLQQGGGMPPRAPGRDFHAGFAGR